MPVFLGTGALVGYTAVKGHWLDVGGKDPYSTDTVDVFQEGTIYPGVKLYRRGERVADLYRMVLANTRVPKMVAGEINAEVVCVRAGAEGLIRVVERFGLETFMQSVEHMFDHGEAVVRAYFEKIPDGRYVGRGRLDDNGVETDLVPFEVAVEVEGSTVRIDYSDAPPMQTGPFNCPLPETVSASRVAVTMLAGGSEAPCEGHFRPLEVVTRRGSMFHPVSPAPCFLYGWPAIQSIEVIYDAIAKTAPERVPAWSGGDICSLVWWGIRERTGEPWADGGAGRARPRRRRDAHAYRPGGDPVLADRGVGGAQPVDDGAGRVGDRFVRRGKVPRRAGARHVLPSAGGRRRDGGHRALQDAAVGA